MVLPVASAMQIAKSYKQTVILSIIMAFLFTISGLYISYYADFKPGGTIVIVGVITLVCILIYKNILSKIILKSVVKTNC